MKSSVKNFCIIVLLFSVTSCNRKSIFTTDIRKNVEDLNLSLTKLQYYIDNDIILSREVSKDTGKINAGIFIYQDGKYYQNIKLKASTRGICTTVFPDRLHISFEKGDNKYLVFATPNSLREDKTYQLLADASSRNDDHIIQYDGKLYKLFVDKNWPKLVIGKKLINKEKYDGRIMKGQRVK